jgi:hypothetical protein
MPIADTLLRLAEEPAFYTPKWSPHILEELQRTFKDKFGYSQAQADHRIESMKLAFPDATVAGYDNLIVSMTNNPKDRHVLAAAVRCGTHAIVSNNVKHFPKESLAPYGLECLTADDFLKHQCHLNPDAFIEVLLQQARNIGRSLPQLIAKHVPSLSTLIIAR